MTDPIDTFNKQRVRSYGDQIIVGYPLPTMTADEALLHAARLVTIAEILDPEHTFEDYLKAVQST